GVTSARAPRPPDTRSGQPSPPSASQRQAVRRECRQQEWQGMSAAKSLDYFVGSNEDGLWNGQAQRLGGLEVDRQLELGGLLDGEIGRLGALQDLVDEHGDALLGVPRVLLVGHQATLLGEGAGGQHRRYSALGREATHERHPYPCQPRRRGSHRGTFAQYASYSAPKVALSSGSSWTR